ncbi:hypothetical protein [Fodinibius saliphilus]|uniref:hypothetical protein n=1 Tax=Fodinibius saliphilus TaxID=1920650 RepID=UPI001108B9E3|nr:hypothetical protein [Fodinibius saliphilus]
MNKDTKTTLHILVLLTIFGPVLKAIVAIIAGDYWGMGISLALFVLFGVLYWFIGIDYFEVDQWVNIETRRKGNQKNISKIILHLLVLLGIIGSFLLALMMFINEEYLKMGILLGLFIIFGALYWFFGINYLKEAKNQH